MKHCKKSGDLLENQEIFWKIRRLGTSAHRFFFSGAEGTECEVPGVKVPGSLVYGALWWVLWELTEDGCDSEEGVGRTVHRQGIVFWIRDRSGIFVSNFVNSYRADRQVQLLKIYKRVISIEVRHNDIRIPVGLYGAIGYTM